MARIPATIEEAATQLRAGHAVVFPTDTVYGIGLAVEFAPDPSALFTLKRRLANKPIGWLIGDPADLDRYAVGIDDRVRDWVRLFWPGGLTLILRASEAVPEGFRAHDGSIGLRMPAEETALSLIRAAGCPLAATSANISGKPVAAQFEEIDPEILDAVCAIRSDNPRSGVASTVIDCRGPEPRILRQGGIELPQPPRR